MLILQQAIYIIIQELDCTLNEASSNGRNFNSVRLIS